MTGPPAYSWCCGATTGKTGCCPHQRRCSQHSDHRPSASNGRRRCPCCDTSNGCVNRSSCVTPPTTTASPADPYLTGLTCCSLLAVPMLGRAMLRAVLVLENRLMRGAFTAERLDAVKLIAGQLAVSLDNAQLYGELAALAERQAALRRVATLVAREVSATEGVLRGGLRMASCLHLGGTLR